MRDPNDRRLLRIDLDKNTACGIRTARPETGGPLSRPAHELSWALYRCDANGVEPLHGVLRLVANPMAPKVLTITSIWLEKGRDGTCEPTPATGSARTTASTRPGTLQMAFKPEPLTQLNGDLSLRLVPEPQRARPARCPSPSPSRRAAYGQAQQRSEMRNVRLRWHAVRRASTASTERQVAKAGMVLTRIDSGASDCAMAMPQSTPLRIRRGCARLIEEVAEGLAQ